MKRGAAPRLHDGLVERFLRVLGIEWREPSLEALGELTAAYVARVPFENVSKLHRFSHLGLTTVPPVELFLDGLEELGFGGTCYSNNYYLYALAGALGFDVRLCGADMRNPDVHLVVLAEVEGRELLLDAGYAAPFLEPLPRDLGVDHVLESGRDRYVLRPRDTEGRSALELYRDGLLKHSYVVKPTPRDLESFGEVIADSYRPNATFRTALLLARFRPGEALFIRNLTVIETRGLVSTSRPLRDRDELVAEVEKRFGIPAAIVSDVVDGLGPLSDPWG